MLLLLVALSGFGALRHARQTYSEASALYASYRNTQRILNEVRADILLSELLVRDYLLDVSRLTAESYRNDLRDVRRRIAAELDELKTLSATDERVRIDRLDQELERYWESLDPLFEWTPQQKVALSWVFLRRHVLPHREAVVSVTDELRDLNRTNLEAQQRGLDAKQSELPGYIARTLGTACLLGLLIAGATIYRTTVLERRTEAQRARAEQAEQELRRLSQQLVKAQEDERRSISRELHDEVGQTLTALRMELRGAGEMRNQEPEFRRHLDDAKRLAEQALRTVRDLAMLLRPAMLDDLGLGAAVEWQAREHARRYGVPVTLQLEGELDTLPDRHRTSIYRIVQEALTNCARHAGAHEIRIAIHGRPSGVSMTIQDDGVGFDRERRGLGLGLIGIEERARELGGRAEVRSQPGKGTTLSVEVPVRSEVEVS